MDYPIKAFEIIGRNDERIKLEITEVYGYPEQTSFRGGYDVVCNLEITAGVYSVYSDHYYSSTGALYDFYTALQKCYDSLNGKAKYAVYCAENDLEFEVVFDQGRVEVIGSYSHDDPTSNNSLHFEFVSDQSYFVAVLNDLKKIVLAMECSNL